MTNFDDRAAELLSWGFERSLHAEDRSSLLAVRQQARADGKPYQIRYRLRSADGSYYWMVEQATLSDGDWQITCTPETSNQQLEQLARVEQKLAFQIERSPLGVIEWDLNFAATEWNAAAQAIFGYSKSEVIGRHAAGLLVPESAKAEVDKVWRSLLQQKGGSRNTNQNLTKDGKTIVCEWYNQPLVDISGRVVGVASLVQDVTAQKQIEAKIQASTLR